ncbi:hypothetical protein lerEdw1_018902 [Lerista edwardsae]|nr:hypothetical protein lerEdw1_018902 [Lerista edwardsae]
MAAEKEPLTTTAGAAAVSPSRREPRVRCRSRRWTRELLGHCGPYVRRLGAGQPLPPQSLERALGEALWNFETAVQENITINGQPWQESSNDLQSDTDIKLLEDQLDELIVEVASKRNLCPRKIQVHVIKTIKTQQNILNCCQPVVNPQEIKVEPSLGKYPVE